jgi:hypothetical protein
VEPHGDASDDDDVESVHDLHTGDPQQHLRLEREENRARGTHGTRRHRAEDEDAEEEPAPQTPDRQARAKKTPEQHSAPFERMLFPVRVHSQCFGLYSSF